jgi:HlyD family secretion protein
MAEAIHEVPISPPRKWYTYSMLRSFILRHTVLFSLAGLCILGALYMLWQVLTTDPLANLVTTTVTRGTVEQIVSVSGLTEAASTAELAFPTTGIVSKVYVKEGDVVAAGDILATLGAEGLVAERSSAIADLRIAEADLAELLNGETASEQIVTTTKVRNAATELARVKTTSALAVTNAERTLRSSDLEARSTDTEERAIAPIVSGTYRCERDGTYTISTYASQTESGYSLRFSGLETGSAGVTTDQPTPLGECGLLVQFDATSRYNDTTWEIIIPNQAAASYTTNKNAVITAKNNATDAIAAATEALTLAEAEAGVVSATPRTEAVARAEARVQKTRSQIASIDAALNDRVITAPFAGMVTYLEILPGETAGTAPVATVLATDNLELTARIPEIDITSIKIAQPARVRFDAERSSSYTGAVSYIAPLPIQIDGVAYFEVKIALTETPEWLRGGLNADIDIITSSVTDVLRVPKRYVTTTTDASAVRTLFDATIATTTVTKLFEGNDGYVAIEGIAEGTVIVTP